MATVNKNFRIKNGLVVEGTTATINGNNILAETTGDSYILNLVGGATLVKSVDTGVFNVDNAGNLTVNANTFDSYGSASAAQAAAEATAAADATTKANAAQLAAETTAALDATSKANAAQAAAEATAAADATTKANAAETAANSYTDGEITTALSTAQGYANTAESDANTYTDTAITNLNLSGTYDALGAAAQALSDAEDYTDTAVANLVDGAPALLDTLNELAAAIADNPNYATDVANLVATKADTTYVDTEISDLNTLAQGYADTAEADAVTTANAYTDGRETAITTAYQSYADTAEADAISAAASDATTKANAAQAAAEVYADGLTDNMLDGTTPFSDININDVAKQVAARSTSLGSVVVTAYQFNKSTFKSGKFLVKIDNGTHNEISEILVTLDSSDNVAITEYAIVGTNGSRGTITADVDGTHCRIRVNPVNDSTITVAGTIFNA